MMARYGRNMYQRGGINENKAAFEMEVYVYK
jgi:hypothetical protein